MVLLYQRLLKTVKTDPPNESNAQDRESKVTKRLPTQTQLTSIYFLERRFLL
ncbi:hypothetical protein [Roseofilum capinflatum]|uniref:Uncharacterized protein n=1 Tax=Roseofilum capinflatum BLCC-M114 TaxID=3022440 RepID=A0ABT7B3M2_9CYAN|nr:hypothetical protein [Roseofilum capinflatum]MDJ1173778.1 hypothetical protein [Roseofilum capinflatum BLCC-M114]